MNPAAAGIQEEEQRLADPYEVVSIALVATPIGCTGTQWHRYEISQGENRIVGYRIGASDNVREAVDTIVENLNRRRRGRRGRVQMTLGQKGAPTPS